MSLFYDLYCLESGECLHLGGLGTTEDGKLSSFFPGFKKPDREERYSHDEVKEAILQFLVRHIGQAVAVVADDHLEPIDPTVDVHDEKHNGELSFSHFDDNYNDKITIEELLNLDGSTDPQDYMGWPGNVSPMVIDCIDKTVSRFDWTSTMDAILEREKDEEYRERIRSCFYWAKNFRGKDYDDINTCPFPIYKATVMALLKDDEIPPDQAIKEAEE